MKISLTKIDSYDLEINGVAFKNMRVTATIKSEGCTVEVVRGSDILERMAA